MEISTKNDFKCSCFSGFEFLHLEKIFHLSLSQSQFSMLKKAANGWDDVIFQQTCKQTVLEGQCEKILWRKCRFLCAFQQFSIFIVIDMRLSKILWFLHLCPNLTDMVLSNILEILTVFLIATISLGLLRFYTKFLDPAKLF